MRIRRHDLLAAVLALAMLGAALAAQAALIFDGLSQHHTIQVLHKGRIVTSVPVPPGATLKIDAKSVSHDKDKRSSTFHGNVKAEVKLAEAVVFSISTEELRLVVSD